MAAAAAVAKVSKSELPPNTVLAVYIQKITDNGHDTDSTLFSTYEAASQFIVRQFSRELGGIKQYYENMEEAYEATEEVDDSVDKEALKKLLSARRAAKRFSPDKLRAMNLSAQITTMLYGIQDEDEQPHYTISLMYRRIHEDGDFDDEYDVLAEEEESEDEDEE